jgi:hypothetical protein
MLYSRSEKRRNKMICQCCQLSDVQSKKRPLCKQCYTELHKEGLLNKFSLIPTISDKTVQERLIERYGASIIDDLKEITNGNLRMVGEKYGFTREYTRQIFEKVFGYKYTVVKMDKRFRHLEAKKAISLLKKDPRHKIEHYPVESLLFKGAMAEKKVLDICHTFGYKVQAYAPDISIDMMINGYMVDVKAAYCTSLTNKTSKTPSFHFQRSESQRKADFIICYAEPINSFFVIPNDKYPSCNQLYIPVKPQSNWLTGTGGKMSSKSKWYAYLEAWHLLQIKKPVELTFANSLEAPASNSDISAADQSSDKIRGTQVTEVSLPFSSSVRQPNYRSVDIPSELSRQEVI